jgi:phage-related protein
MKRIEFRGRSPAAIRDFPTYVRREAGYQLDRAQHGLDPTDWKPIPTVGKGVREIRIRAEGQFRVIYLTQSPNLVVVLHAFQKKSRKTPKHEVDQARRNFRKAFSDQST